MLFDECPKFAGGFLSLRREGYGGGDAVHPAIAAVDRPVAGVAEPSGRFGECVEHWLQIEGRTADDLQHVARCGLVFERFLKVGGAVAQLVQQPRVLDRDHRLCSKALQ